MTPRRPDLFVIGGPKCGTTSLGRYLAGHPDIFFYTEREPNRFNLDHGGPHPSIADYEKMFHGASRSHKAIGEKSPWNLTPRWP
jgi:hypothetical protein